MKRAAASLPPPHGRALPLAALALLAPASALTIAGCGQKGPLYLPQRTGTVITRRAPSAPAPASPSASSSSSSAAAPGK